MGKTEILNRVYLFNKGCGFTKQMFDLKKKHFSWALEYGAITEEEFNYYFT